MYDTSLTRQALPDEKLRMLIGTALVVFNANVAFLIENFLREYSDTEDWWSLMDSTAGGVGKKTEKVLKEMEQDADALFLGLVERRNRIIHSFQITRKDSSQGIQTLVRDTREQFEITEDYLKQFISENQKFSDLLYKFRGY